MGNNETDPIDPDPIDDEIPNEDINGLVTNVADAQVDKMSGTLIDPLVNPEGSGILGNIGYVSPDLDEANDWVEEESVGRNGADDPNDPRS